MKHKALNIVIACAMFTSVGAQAATFETSETKKAESTQSTDKTAQDILNGTGSKETKTKDRNALNKAISATAKQVERTTKEGVKTGKETVNLIKAAINVGTSHGIKDIDAVVNTVKARGFKNVAKLKSVLTNLFTESPANFEEVEQVLTSPELKLSSDPAVAKDQEKAVDAYIDVANAISQSHGGRIQLSAKQFVSNEEAYKGSRAEAVEAEILETVARKIYNGKFTDVMAAIKDTEVKLFMDRKGMTLEEAVKASEELNKQHCVG